MNSNLAYKEELREERLGGRTVAMSPRPAFNHNRIASRIYWLFENHLNGHIYTAIGDGTDLYLSEEDRFVPDMMVVCDRNKIQNDGVHGAPDLVVEVLSPSTAQNDRGYKMGAYQRYGAREYWIVSPSEKNIEQYFLQEGAFVLNAVYAVHPDYALRQMTEEERAAALAPFRCSLFDDMEISISDIFDGLLQ